MLKFQINPRSGRHSINFCNPTAQRSRLQCWKQSFGFLTPNFQNFCRMQFFELEGVPHIDGKLYESTFIWLWNRINQSRIERDMSWRTKRGQSAQKNTFCWFEVPSWSSLFLWQGYITTHIYDVIKHWEGSRIRKYSEWSLEVQGKAMQKEGVLNQIGLGVVNQIFLYLPLISDFPMYVHYI